MNGLTCIVDNSVVAGRVAGASMAWPCSSRRTRGGCAVRHGEQRDGVAAQPRRAEIAAESVAALAISHAHYDHTEGCPRCCRASARRDAALRAPRFRRARAVCVARGRTPNR